MTAATKPEAMRVISGIDLTPYAESAIEHHELARDDFDEAVNDYRHFLLLVWIRQVRRDTELVVPTERADAIWHQHILHTIDYRRLCNDLTGAYIDHFPGLTKGSEPFNRAVEFTRKLSRNHASDGFAPYYLGAKPKRGSNWGNCGAVVLGNDGEGDSAAAADAAAGGGDGGGCGGGCGGGGCGG